MLPPPPGEQELLWGWGPTSPVPMWPLGSARAPCVEVARKAKGPGPAEHQLQAEDQLRPRALRARDRRRGAWSGDKWEWGASRSQGLGSRGCGRGGVGSQPQRTPSWKEGEGVSGRNSGAAGWHPEGRVWSFRGSAQGGKEDLPWGEGKARGLCLQAPLPPPQNPGLGPEPGVPEPRRDRGTGKASGNLGFMEPDPGPGAEAGTAHMPAPAAGSGHRLRLEWAQAGAGVPTRTQGPAEVPKGSQALWEVEEGAGGGGGGPGVPTTQAGPADISASAERVVICQKAAVFTVYPLNNLFFAVGVLPPQTRWRWQLAESS